MTGAARSLSREAGEGQGRGEAKQIADGGCRDDIRVVV